MSAQLQRQTLEPRKMGRPVGVLGASIDRLSEEYGITARKVRYHGLTLFDQVERCQSDEARRILLGVSS